jgi:L-alanine-DL-glutamate epimerase-like enolase superfamily enzyme
VSETKLRELNLNYAGKTPMTPAEAGADAAIRLKRMDLFPVAVPLRQPMKMAGVVIREAENLFLRIESADGFTGWGEAASAPAMTGETLCGMTAAARLIWEAIKDCDARFRPDLMRRIQASIYGNTSAKSAVEMALIDLLGRRLGVSAVEILGGRYRDVLEPMWLLGHGTPEEDIEEAGLQHAKGYRFFKLKVGTKSIENDIASVMGVRTAIGPAAKLCADANGGLEFAAARRLVRETESANLLYLEQPLPAGSLDQLAKLNQLGVVPVGIDEGIHSRHDIETHAARGAASGVSLKLIKLGGLAAALECAGRAIELGLSINVAAKVAETSLASAAAAHVAAAIRNFDWGLSLTQIYLAHDPVHNALRIENGRVAPPPGQGLGIDVDETALRHFQCALAA